MAIEVGSSGDTIRNYSLASVVMYGVPRTPMQVASFWDRQIGPDSVHLSFTLRSLAVGEGSPVFDN